MDDDASLAVGKLVEDFDDEDIGRALKNIDPQRLGGVVKQLDESDLEKVLGGSHEFVDST
jgi:hypothetical protein